MFDFSNYTLQELQAMSDLLDYLREDAGADAQSYFCGCSLLQAIKRESLRLSRSILMSLEEQAHAFPAFDAAGDPPAFDAAGDPPAFDAAGDPPASAPPAEEPDDLRTVVDALSGCSDCLAALALAEDMHFEKDGRLDTFIKLTTLRNANRSIIDILADIRDHFEEVLSDD